MFRAFSSRLRKLARDERGTSLIEFGILAPVLGMLVVGIVDLSQGMSARFSLQQSVDRSLQLLLARPATADADSDDIDYSFLLHEAAAAADVPEGQVSIDRWLQCDDERQDDYTDSCEDGQDSARYLEISIQKDFVGTLYLGTVPLTVRGAVRIQ